MRLFAAALVVLVAFGCKEKTESVPVAMPKSDALVQRVADEARKKHPESKVTILSDDEILVKSGELETTIGMDNIRKSCAMETACADAINNAVANVQTKALPKDEKLDRKQILLTLKTSEYLESVDKMMKEKVPEKFENNRIARTPFIAGMMVVYVLDSPTGMRMISGQDLKENDLTVESIDALARENLGAAFPELTPMEEVGKGIYTNTKDENYASALLVLTDRWSPLAKQVKEPLLVAVPSRNRMFAMSAKNTAAIEAFKVVTKTAFENEDHALSGTVLEWTPKGFKEWVPAAK